MNIWLALIIIVELSLAQNASHNGKSYFFKMGKNSNEFRVNNRIMYLNHNITDLDLPIMENRKKVYQAVEKVPKLDFSMYLDEEWKYEHKNFNKSHLPMFVGKFYEEISATQESTLFTRILFNTNRNKSSPILKFNLDTLSPENTIIDAELYFYWALKNTSKVFRESVVLRLYQFEKHNDHFNGSEFVQNPDIHKLFSVIYVSKAHKGWQMFKVKKPLDNWLNGEENLGLILTISSYDTNELIEVFNDTNSGNFSTFIIAKSHNNDSLSENNGIVTGGREDTFAPCQRQSWNINFNKMGWDKFIILPEEFTAYDCIGKCSKPMEKDTNHAKFLYMFQKRSSCCVPTRFLPLTIMYFDKFGDIAIKNYDKAIVTHCECR